MPDFSFLNDGNQDDGTIRINTSRPDVRARRTKPVQSGNQPSTAAGCLVFLVLFGGCVYWVGTIKPPTREEFDKQDNRAQAVVCAQDHIKRNLRSPASAKWPGVFSGVDVQNHAVRLNDGTYMVKSYVDSQNGFGAMIRTHYIVHLRVLPDFKAQILDAQWSD